MHHPVDLAHLMHRIDSIDASTGRSLP